ncbi:MAG: hypothetical protein NTZ01_05550 [Verrucomicrobia bacterium]|nr:hypothetical protein [Verrucomicrobiota bacterium]
MSLLFVMACGSAWAESYADYVARHKRTQKLMNPMNVPVANVMNDAWDANPEYADPNARVATPGPKVFYIKSSRDDHGRVTYLTKAK